MSPSLTLEILGNPRAKKVSRIFKEPVLNYQVFKPFYARLGLAGEPVAAGPAGGLNNYSICTSCIHHVKTKTYNIAAIGDPVHFYIYVYMYIMIFVHNDRLRAVQIDY